MYTQFGDLDVQKIINDIKAKIGHQGKVDAAIIVINISEYRASV